MLTTFPAHCFAVFFAHLIYNLTVLHIVCEPTALFNPETRISVQKRHPCTRNLNRETPGDSKNAFLHWGDVLGTLSFALVVEAMRCHFQSLCKRTRGSSTVHGRARLDVYTRNPKLHLYNNPKNLYPLNLLVV